MSRELKFRIWDSISQIYYDESDEPVLEFMHEQDGIVLDYHNYSDERVYTIEQFTGLVDKNGKEIFEGDIVKLHKVDEKSFGEKSPLIEIAGFSQKNCEKYNNTAAATTGFFGAILTKKRGSCVGLSWNQAIYEHYEIIGNIHENGGLLK